MARRLASRPAPIPAPANGGLHPAMLRVIVAMAEADEAEDWAKRKAAGPSDLEHRTDAHD